MGQVISFAGTGSASKLAIDSESFIFHVTIFILAILGVIFLYRLPRGIALFGSNEWLSGYILRYIPYRPARSASRSQRIVQAVHSVYPPPNQPPSPTSQGHAHDITSDESHTLAYHQQAFRRVDAMGQEIKMQYPTHIASCPSFMRWSLPTLRHRFTPNYSVGQVIVIAIYSCILIYAAFIKANVFVDYHHVGWVSVAQLPFVVAYGAKNNVLGTLFGMGYERLNYLHRFAGRAVVLMANLHGVGYVYTWSLAGTFTSSIYNPQNTWGLVTLAAVDVLWIFSLDYFRKRVYNIFLMMHIMCFGVILAGLYLHMPELVPFVLTTIALFGLDHVLRIVKTRIVTATIRPLPELDLTRIEIPNINAGWRAGQHVRVRILSRGVGLFGWAEVHPFTIASVGVSDALIGGSGVGNIRRGGLRGGGGGEGMVLMCKRTGTWTKRLYEMAKMSGYVDGFLGREVKVWLEGPYGGPGHMNFASFSAAVIVVGGSGITFGLSVVKDLVEKDLKGRSRVKAIELIWTVPEPSALTPLIPTFATLINQSIFTPLRISVHYTRASHTIPSVPSIPGLTFNPGRPRISKIVDYAVSKALSVGAHFDTPEIRHPTTLDIQEITGVAVGVCGPAELAKDVVDAVGSVDSERRNRVGGIEVHEEVFGW
ncbi:Ferric/cupric reductase transmembrane component 2 [Leucoagaricus sp. SymC.cos]|nr:Ferric/cupric reductase transmembrane component 2 [Leucoagaricus sp. SymC.cos]